MNQASWGRMMQIAFLPVIVFVFYLNAVSHFGYTPDDTFIYLQYARNFVAGFGISFNPGQPSYGITSPLWFLMISGAGILKLDLLTAAKVMDLVFASSSLIVFYLVAFEVIRDGAVAICATVAFSVNAWLLRWAGTGMETSLSVFVVLLVLLACLRNSYILAGVLAAIATLVRPEACLMLPVIATDIITNSHDRRRGFTLVRMVGVAYAGILLPWLVFAYRTFGTIIPNTASAKAGLSFDLHDMSGAALDLMKTIGAADGLGVLFILIAVVILTLSRKKAISPDGRIEDDRFFLIRQSLVGLGWLALLSVCYIVTSTNVVSRYLLIVTPVITIFALLYAHRIFLSRLAGRISYAAVIFVTALMMLQHQWFYHSRVKPGIAAFEQGMELCFIPIADWFRDHTPPGTTIFAPDIGALGYYSGRRICDASGLITPELLPLIHQGRTQRDMIRDHLYARICNADYVVYRSFTPEDLKDEPDLSPVVTRPFTGLDLTESRVMYYTVYKVRHLSSLHDRRESAQ